jgi:DNA-directed RNA polymerase specialized sigma24 family protein
VSNSTAQVFTDHLQVLFGPGTCAGMTDGQLLERFLAGRNEGGELAFEALVMRHGPMVMRVCRNLVGDPNDVHDAFQAVFLVLARRASAIRDRESVGSWLYGVAARVAARARASAIGHNIRERRTNQAAQSIASKAGSRLTASSMRANNSHWLN